MSRALVPAAPGRRAAAPPPPLPSLWPNMLAAGLAIALGFGGLALWGFTARLDSASVGPGTVVVDTRRKSVTHLEGGLLREMRVRDGEEVSAGQVLFVMEDKRARVELGQLEARRLGQLARLARLGAEQSGASGVRFPPELTAGGDGTAEAILSNEVRLFESRRDMQRRVVESLEAQIATQAAEGAASSAQRRAAEAGEVLVREQMAAISKLATQGFATRAQIAELEARLSVLAGNRGEHAAGEARARQAMAGLQAEIARAEMARQSDIADQIQSARIELNASLDQQRAAADTLSRVEVRAPEAGIVADIRIRAPGTVIGAGMPVLDIVPVNDARVIEARINPRDIDAVHPGSPVRVRLPSYNTREVPYLEGTLTYVAPDQTVDEKTSLAFYLVRAEVAPASLEAHPTVKLYPGMPADLLVLNRPRLAIDYLLSPLTDSVNTAFREE
ncbi:HlyD family type I secretion periplasmic adaptor subunit [Aureimonas sp. AU40]|uniref:HlyD family type I secretion periplasmic adaptor subunit n=1 Tax=Aureimonas sp. AU40 TaxID=1637747 RepID=UPI000784CB14|nr:HlyD family type I secretion periplasmic adaptor subunit [Aureimonas sp. AU40]